MKQLINILVASLFLSACATTEITPIASIQSINGGFNVPYRVSDAGHFLVDVSINESERRPFILDTGANVSVIYEPTATQIETMWGFLKEIIDFSKIPKKMTEECLEV